MAAKKFDMLVLGGGSAGMATAHRAAELGAKVALFEFKRLGGICYWITLAVPKKVMLNTVMHAEMLNDHKSYGFNVKQSGFTWSTIQEARDAYVQHLNSQYTERVRANKKVTYVDGYAKFTGGDTVECNGEIYQGKHIVIATGGRPIMPDIPGSDLGVACDDFFDIKELPKKTAIVGAGYIAVELASILNKLGSDTHLFIRKDKALRIFDQMVSDNVTKTLEEAGVTIVRNSLSKKLVSQPDNRMTYTTTAGVFKDFDCVIWAIGRTPNSWDVDIQNTPVQLDSLSNIIVDEYQNTTANNVYAIGDVTGKKLLTPVAIKVGRKLANRIFNNEPLAKMDYRFIPTVVYSAPPVGFIGMTQAEAEKLYGASNVKTYETSYDNMYFAVTDRKEKTYLKLVCAEADQKVVGLHMVGLGCDEMLQGYSLAMQKNATKYDFDEMIHEHPPSAEGMYLEI